MDTQIILIYCSCDDLLKAMRHGEDAQCQMSDAEVMTVALVAVLHYLGNFALAERMLAVHGYLPVLMGKSRFSRRLHWVKHLFLLLFAHFGEYFKSMNEEAVYIIDTFPIAACDNYRIPRSKRYCGEAYRGYQASKKRYFYGLKVHLLVTAHAEQVEFFFTPGSVSDVAGLGFFDFDLPTGAQIIGDKAYSDYELEDVLREADLLLTLMRKSNSKRPFPPGRNTCKPTFARPWRRRGVYSNGSCPNPFMLSLPRELNSNSRSLSLLSAFPANHTGAPFEFLVDTLKAIGDANQTTMSCWEIKGRQSIDQVLVDPRRKLGSRPA